jgi:hypothetical protein
MSCLGSGSQGKDAWRNDNDILVQGSRIADFNWNVIQPSWSRKLFNPGRHDGSLVYGIDGPRILISHPFQGLTGHDTGVVYDMYMNCADVWSSLVIRGYHGSFLFCDCMDGLNFDVHGIPGWAVWFSLVACQSDLVVFVRVDGTFSASQQLEISLTPDRVQKKIVDLPKGELRWATGGPKFDEMWHIDERGRISPDEAFAKEREHALPFIENYWRSFPDDRLVIVGTEGEVEFLSLDTDLYASGC